MLTMVQTCASNSEAFCFMHDTEGLNASRNNLMQRVLRREGKNNNKKITATSS